MMLSRILAAAVLLAGAFASTPGRAQNLMPNLEDAFLKQQWDTVVQLSTDILRQNPGNTQARVRGAFALIQKGFPNAALHQVRRLTAAEWKSVPEDMKQLVEVVALFQKKVPIISLPARIDQLNEAESSPFIQDEIRFAKGRAAFERGEEAAAKALLNQVAKGSRWFGPASYLLGTMAVRHRDYNTAATHFSRTFDPQVLQQSTEFWNELNTQSTGQWGTALSVGMDSGSLRKSADVAELSVLAMARILYAQKDFLTAIAQYSKIPRTSPLFSLARLETVWAMLQLDEHAKAAQAALDLSTDAEHFESMEALPVRALILTDSGRPLEGRTEILKFLEVYKQSKDTLLRYRQFPNADTLPAYIKGDMKDDKRLAAIQSYQTTLKAEIAALRAQDRTFFPAYWMFATELDPLVNQSREYAGRLAMEHVDRRLADFERLYVQGKLIVAETFLEEREKLRAEFKGKGVNEAEQNSHDRQLVALLLQAVKEVDEARAAMKTRNLSLEFRQSELLWELSSASAFLDQDSAGTTGKEAYEKYRSRAIAIARQLTDENPNFEKRPQALFFLGFALMEVGDDKQGLGYLARYLKEYPNHENVPNAYRILADVEFDANRFAKADELYKQILKFPGSPIVGYALYKIGWCAYNQKNYAKALLGLEQAILWTRSLENTAHLLSLKREAGHDLISIYAEIGSHKRAYEYFERFLGGNDAPKWLSDLAAEYERNGLFERSNDLYVQLLGLNPSPEDRMKFQTSLIFGEYQLRDWSKVLQRTRELVGAYEATLQVPGDVDAPSYKTEKVLNDIVMAQHFEFDQYAGKDDVARILEIDQLYLKAFSKWPSSQMPLYQYAHFLMKYKRVPEAAVAFAAHWEQFKATLKEPLREESLRNLVHALETADGEKLDDAEVAAKRAEDLVTYTAEYAAAYPTTKHARPIAFLRTVALLKHDKNELGLEESQKVFDQSWNDEFGDRAFQNLKVVYYKLKDWKRTYEWASALLTKPGIEKTKYLGDLKTVREESLFLWADGTEDDRAAAELYLKIAEDPQMLRLRPKALYNAFVRYKELNQRPQALDIANRLEQAAPQGAEIQGIAGIRAAYYHEAGDYEKALPLYEKFLKNPTKETTPEALSQARVSAGLFSEMLGKAAIATAHYQAVLSSSKDPAAPDAVAAKQGLDRMAEAAKRQPASTAVPPFKKWDGLLATMLELEKQPLVKAEGLAQRIQGGAAKLEKAVRTFVEVSTDPATPPYYAFETYCAVPFLYTYYQNGVRALGDGQPDDLKAELEKIVSPLAPKATEMANQCASRATEAFHDGPMYRKALRTWGWSANPATIEQMKKIAGLLKAGAPWIEPAPVDKTEAALITDHLEDRGTPDTWYSLAKKRYDAGKPGLARLTLLNALGKAPDSGRILNALAVIRQVDGTTPIVLDGLYAKAGEAGSGLAYLNLALIHLNGARMELTRDALKKARSNGAFEDHPEFRSVVDDLDDAIETPIPSNDAAQGGKP